MFENKWFPKAQKLGISWDDFWKMNPRIIKIHLKAHDEWIKEQDYLMWLQGRYFHDALMVGLSRFASKNSTAEYPKNSYLSDITENAKTTSKSDNELAKSAENFMLRLQIMGANYERAQREKNKDS